MKKLMLVLLILFSANYSCAADGISARSACMIVASSGEILYEKEAHMKLPMASTTKMMTALLAAESGQWEDTVTISRNSQNQEGSRIYLEAGERMKLSDLVCGMLLNSGNDAAVAVAEHIGENCEAFALAMTERAKALGATDTSFKNPSGLDAPGHFSTAYDLALIGSEVINNELLSDITACRNMKFEAADGNTTYLKNHNKLLWNYEGAIGVKTGFTKTSGRCLVSAARRGGVTLVAVTLNAPDDWNDHKKLLDYGFKICSAERVIGKGDILARVRIGDKVLGYEADADAAAVKVIGKAKNCTTVLHRIKEPAAPIARGEKLGTAEILQNGRKIAEVNLVASCDIYKKDEKTGVFARLAEKINRFMQ